MTYVFSIQSEPIKKFDGTRVQQSGTVRDMFPTPDTFLSSCYKLQFTKVSGKNSLLLLNGYQVQTKQTGRIF